MYQQIRLPDLKPIGAPDSLPYVVAGWPDDLLRDLEGTDESFGLRGTAFWPVIVTTPAFDPDTEMLTGDVTGLTIDKANFRFTATQAKRALTVDELAALHPVPVTISRRQFFQQLAIAGLITEDEALAALTGTIPDAMSAVVQSLLDGQKFAARMLLIGAQEFARDNEFVAVFAAAQNMTNAQVDDLWRAASLL